MRLFNPNSCIIINNYRKKKYQNIDWNKETIKNTACQKQVKPTIFMRDSKINECYEWKKQQKLKGIEKHFSE
jgi:hypothetical protein